MGGRFAVQACVFVIVVLTGTTLSARAEESLRPPEAGWGSATQPMSEHEGSGGMPIPIFRVFNPCEEVRVTTTTTPGSTERQGRGKVYARLSREPGYYPQFSTSPGFSLGSSRGDAEARIATLECRWMSIVPYGAYTWWTWCDRGLPVKGSYGYSHGFGPIITPYWAPRLGMVNWGWVTADVTLWWLCE